MIVSPTDALWDESLGTFAAPRPGESLLGYLLHQGALNDIDDPRFVPNTVVRNGYPIHRVSSPGTWLSARMIDVERVSALAGLRDVAQVEAMTARPLIRWLYPGTADGPMVGFFGQRRRIALCPACIREGYVSLASLFAFMTVCPRHGLRLIELCGDHPIRLFDGDYYRCPDLDCLRFFRDLEEIAVDGAERDLNAAFERTLSDLMTSALGAEPLRGPFGPVLRVLLERHDVGDARLRSATRYLDRPTIATVVEALARTQMSAADWLALVRTGSAWRDRRNHDGAVLFFRSDPKCPQCGDRRPWKDGRMPSRPREPQFICKMCGTRFTRTRVLFSFDPHPTYSDVFMERNRRHLARCTQALATVLREWRGRALTQRRAFELAGIPRSVAYLTPRAGLVALVQATRREAAVARATTAA